MTELKKIYKKDIPFLMDDAAFWQHDFLAISKHRLHAHYKNPTTDDNDIVLLLAYINNELVGYMGVFIDTIVLDGTATKIGWLSTWWVHPKTKGTGIGRQILDEMYQLNYGKIGISQYTPSAKRVYDKSGYFVNLKENKGIKAVLRSNLVFVIPALFPWAAKLKMVFSFTDSCINFFVNIKLAVQNALIINKVNDCVINYLNTPDSETMALMQKRNTNHISEKDQRFFEWLKAYHWVQESPLLSLTDKKRYEFSMYDKSFNIYLIKVMKLKQCIGFIVLQKRNTVCKVLFTYYEPQHARAVANIVKLQLIAQNTKELICYDELMCKQMKNSSIFLYTTKKLKQSIISKEFGKTDFDDVIMNFGDGDCSFA